MVLSCSLRKAIFFASKEDKSNDLYEVANETKTIYQMQKEGHHLFLSLLIGIRTETKRFQAAGGFSRSFGDLFFLHDHP